jgi:hypothetical protein
MSQTLRSSILVALLQTAPEFFPFQDSSRSCCGGLSTQVGFALKHPVLPLCSKPLLSFSPFKILLAPVAAGSARKSASPLKHPVLPLSSKPFLSLRGLAEG